VQQNDGRWSIPGGYVERGEDSAAAAVRETWEEARVVVRAGEPRCAVPSNRFVAHVCTVEEAPSPFADGKETRDARFFTREELEALEPSELRFPDQKEAYLRELEAR
jgi:8-oxo-dGTP pyrophosphatase MutT (NUDIX family)